VGMVAEDTGFKFGYIDKTGSWVIEPRFDNASSFSEGLAAVSEDGEWGYVDTTGTMVIEPRLWGAFDFRGGIARVGHAPVSLEGGTAYEGYIDKAGEIIFEFVQSDFVP